MLIATCTCRASPELIHNNELLDVLAIKDHRVPKVRHSLVQRVVEETGSALGDLAEGDIPNR